jgi:uncharacterized protein (DUF983 family)
VTMKAHKKYGEKPATLGSVAVMLGRGLRRHCPHCGARKIFTKYFKLSERCPTCGIKFERLAGFSLGVMTVNIIVTFLLIGVSLGVTIVATVPDIPMVPLMLVCMGIGLFVPIFFYPFATMVWLVVDLGMSPLTEAQLLDGRVNSSAPVG